MLSCGSRLHHLYHCVYLIRTINLMILFACHIAMKMYKNHGDYRDDNFFIFRFYFSVFVVCCCAEELFARFVIDAIAVTLGRYNFFRVIYEIVQPTSATLFVDCVKYLIVGDACEPVRAIFHDNRLKIANILFQ